MAEATPPSAAATAVPWWRALSSYHWFVFFVASGAWFFDNIDQRLFSLARVPALQTLILNPQVGEISAAAKHVTAIFLIGWGIGGMIFGALGDRYGRARMLTFTVVLYCCFTALTFFSTDFWNFALCRFLTGLGIGGVFGLAVALIAETVPDHARTGALGTLQVLSTVGNISAALIKLFVDELVSRGSLKAGLGWRVLFLSGIVPALLILLAQRKLREPEPWLRAKAEGRLRQGGIFSSYAGILKERRWRKNLIVGALIASTGVVALWGIGEYAVDLQRNVFTTWYQDNGVPPDQLTARVNLTIIKIYIVSMVMGGLGMALFTRVAGWMGRRPAFALGFSAAMIATIMGFWQMSSPAQGYWMMPLMTGCQLAVFAGFAIYLPELFPSRLRSTGTSFCYNLGRFAAAAGSLFSAAMATKLYGHFGSPAMERYSAMTMCVIFLVGLLTLPFAPETRGKPLPEEQPTLVPP